MSEISGTKEWSSHSKNIQTGCSHNCGYCYARAMAMRFKRVEKETWKEPQIRDLPKKYKKRVGRIMFPTSHDISPLNINECVEVLKGMLEVGNDVLIVSKPHRECIEVLCKELEEYKSQIVFRFSIGSLDSKILKLWEPGAPSFEERFDCLKYAFEKGFVTSVSMEPILDTSEDNIVKLVETLLPYVNDSIWLGKMNRLRSTLSNNKITHLDDEANKLIASQSDARIKSLYSRLLSYEKLKYKESIKKVVGIKLQTKAGEDV